jgi:hypothetical protein
MKLSKWMPDPDAPYCCMRIREGGDPNNISDRYAFIEKTPRVRIRDSRLAQCDDQYNWCSGAKGSPAEKKPDGSYEYNLTSQAWADGMLWAMGHKLPGIPERLCN